MVDVSSQNRRRYLVGMIVTTFVAVVIAVIVNIVYTQHVQTQSNHRAAELRHRQDQRLCPLLEALDQPSVPATTDRGRIIQQRVHVLRIELGC